MWKYFLYRRFIGWLKAEEKKYITEIECVWYIYYVIRICTTTTTTLYICTYTFYSTLLCRFTILPNQLIITHMTFGLLLCFALLCLYDIVAYTNHEFIYLISFHVQIENQYHFRSIVCAAGKLE